MVKFNFDKDLIKIIEKNKIEKIGDTILIRHY
jgi:hypothetical protein